MIETTIIFLEMTKAELQLELKAIQEAMENPLTTPERYAFFEAEYFDLDNLYDSFVAVINFLKHDM